MNTCWRCWIIAYRSGLLSAAYADHCQLIIAVPADRVHAGRVAPRWLSHRWDTDESSRRPLDPEAASLASVTAPVQSAAVLALRYRRRGSAAERPGGGTGSRCT